MDYKLYKGSLEPLILKVIAEEKKVYGYQLTKIISEQTMGEILIKEGSLYPLLHRMEADGIIKSSILKVGNRNRKYYEITEQGNEKAHDLLEEMNAYLQMMTRIFNPSLHKG